MNIDKIPEHILEDLRERCTDEEIKDCSPEYLFKEYCEWNGLRGWASSLLIAIESLRAADS